MSTSTTSRPDLAKVRSSTVLALVAILIIVALGVSCLVLLAKLSDAATPPTVYPHIAPTSVPARVSDLLDLDAGLPGITDGIDREARP